MLAGFLHVFAFGGQILFVNLFAGAQFLPKQHIFCPAVVPVLYPHLPPGQEQTASPLTSTSTPQILQIF